MMKNIKALQLLFVIAFSLNVIGVKAQVKRKYSNNTNGWFMYVGSHKVSAKWGIHLEAQWRRSEIVLHNQQLLLRTGINYYVNPQVSLTAGYAYVITYPYGELAAPLMFPENRIWEQLNMRSAMGAVEIINRFRLEQRYVNSPVKSGNDFIVGPAVYTNRVRWMNRYSVPFKGKTIEDRSLYLSAYNELYINFGKNVGYNIFDQNRAYLALGYKIPKLGRLEIGYLHQLIMRSNGINLEQNHTLQIGLSSSLEFRKKQE
jgi:hypothetical protein